MSQYGMPTVIETATPLEAARLCRKLGLDFVELNLNFPGFLLHRLEAGALQTLAEEYAVGYTIHLDDEMNVADFNPLIAQACCRTVTGAVDLARAIGAKKINMHLSRGAKYTLPDRVIYFIEAYRREYLESMRAFRDACQAAVGQSEVRICIENTGGFLPVQREAVELLLESPAFGLTLDIGHNYCAGNADQEWILAHRDRLLHFHIHDALDGRKDHRELGSGVLDIAGYLALARELGASVVLETKTADSLARSADWVRAWQEGKK